MTSKTKNKQTGCTYDDAITALQNAKIAQSGFFLSIDNDDKINEIAANLEPSSLGAMVISILEDHELPRLIVRGYLSEN
jgi:hypothetical protein